jgi:hypothetical protein
MNSYLLNLDTSGVLQGEADYSYIGGLPRLPCSVELPICSLCGRELTFIFQIAFPDGKIWEGYSLAIFACTSCVNEDFLIPELLTPLQGVNIPDNFLNRYQVNFRFIVFETESSALKQDYVEKVKFQRWLLELTEDRLAPGNKIGGDADWILDDESPSTYKSEVPLIFLLQLEENFRFGMVDGAPPQMDIDWSGSRGAQKPSNRPYYELFIGDALYLFGTDSATERLVYAVVQCS